MKVNFKHGIVYTPKYNTLTKNSKVRMNTFGSYSLYVFLYQKSSILFWVDSNIEIAWSVSSKRNRLFLEYKSGKVFPLSIESDGTEWVKSGSKNPAKAPAASIFYNTIEDKIYVMMDGRWQDRSVISIASVVGNSITMTPVGNQMSQTVESSTGYVINGQDGVMLPEYISSMHYTMGTVIQSIGTHTDNIIAVSENKLNLQKYTAVSFDGSNLVHASSVNPCNGIIVLNDNGICLICKAGIVIDCLLQLEHGKVFHNGLGQLSNVPNDSFYQEIGFYDAIKRHLIVDIKNREYMI